MEVLNDPHLKERNFFFEMPHPDAGTRRYAGVPMKLSRTPATFRLPAPCLGEHNDYILGQLLGLSKEEIAQLEQSKVIGNADPEM
jgi:formyl-CoA transferase